MRPTPSNEQEHPLLCLAFSKLIGLTTGAENGPQDEDICRGEWSDCLNVVKNGRYLCPDLGMTFRKQFDSTIEVQKCGVDEGEMCVAQFGCESLVMGRQCGGRRSLVGNGEYFPLEDLRFICQFLGKGRGWLSKGF
ncbi:hypothetical protein IFM46972_01201 [Aspergillus udagawae]|uniref:Uncharacterized protein n=1 Tax=Aspergillus udagawae TaxID=91492 RepID=A0A8H3N497_9EURO|nr:hypothetical protein IFM46972_01201 [Aspergillus udagawae]